MKAVILAGGKGTRLRPLTYSIPKPLVAVGMKPILEIIIELLRDHDFKDIILTVEYKAEIIKAYFRDGSSLGVNIYYHHENRFSGTAGPVKQVKHLLGDEPFVTMNGDLLTDMDLSEMYQIHADKSSELTMATTAYAITLPYGIVDAQDDKIISIREKPTMNFLINAGVYILSPSALDIVPANAPFDMPDLIQSLVDQKRKVGTYFIDGEWQDLGTMENYEKANLDSGDFQEQAANYPLTIQSVSSI